MQDPTASAPTPAPIRSAIRRLAGPALGLLALTLVGTSCGSSTENQAEDPAKGEAASAAQDAAAQPQTPETQTMNDIYALQAESLAGQPVDLSDYRGKVTLVVNVASKCGYTPQYAGLQALHAEMEDRGFAVLGFPSNDFGGQEPGSAEQIQEFCSSNYGVDFPMFAKVGTKAGANQSPVYAALQKSTGEAPNWNFCKYLVGKDGEVLAFYPSATGPDSAELKQAIEAALE